MPQKLRLLTVTLSTPIGKLVVISDENGCLRATDWSDYEDRMRRLLARHHGKDEVELIPAPPSFGPASVIAAYFDGEIHAIDSLPTSTEGTAFQKRVWQALREIPAGQTVSYGELATHIGKPAAVRAVGLANGANPIGIVVPCHRVIGADGSLTGYGGGLERKRWLLNHEMRAVRRSSVAAAFHEIHRQDDTMRLFY
ncbi:MAG: methylated-DNA--[protein]-cysteine S-methyltransferase [Nitrospira sp.]|nr:methylated-DNA--[protein]-cysteine S-methyltransferase [Nitrospira sp.]